MTVEVWRCVECDFCNDVSTNEIPPSTCICGGKMKLVGMYKVDLEGVRV